jgi:hypothetical protein
MPKALKSSHNILSLSQTRQNNVSVVVSARESDCEVSSLSLHHISPSPGPTGCIASLIPSIHILTTRLIGYCFGSSLDRTKEAFDEAVVLFGTALPKDNRKSQWLSNSEANSLEDVLDCIRDAQAEYESRRGRSKLRECLSSLAERVHHYGNIMDVLVQHHPEYVALAWGAMKVLFVVNVIDHPFWSIVRSDGLIRCRQS